MILGINSMVDDVKKIAALIKEIHPDRIHLNTVIRPPAEDFAGAVSTNDLENISYLLDPHAEVIAEFNAGSTKQTGINKDIIFSLLRRRPCTMKQIAEVYGMHVNEVSKYLGSLMREELIYNVHKKTDIYYNAIIKENIAGLEPKHVKFCRCNSDREIEEPLLVTLLPTTVVS